MKQLNCNISTREIEIIELVSQGLTDKEIGMQLYISHYTVADHRKNVKAKMGCVNGPNMVRRAFELGLLPIGPADSILRIAS